MRYAKQLFGRLIRNKYALTLMLFAAWVALFDQNNLIERLSLHLQAQQLEEARDYYRQVVAQNRSRLHELKTGDENLEKYAREQYLMRRENEDVFVIAE